jgi:hypothetical protein
VRIIRSLKKARYWIQLVATRLSSSAGTGSNYGNPIPTSSPFWRSKDYTSQYKQLVWTRTSDQNISKYLHWSWDIHLESWAPPPMRPQSHHLGLCSSKTSQRKKIFWTLCRQFNKLADVGGFHPINQFARTQSNTMIKFTVLCHVSISYLSLYLL